MGFNLQNKFLSSVSTMMLLVGLTVSCLPVQKKTQCAESEAFNATKRQCVPVIGASTSNTVFVGSKSPQNSYSVSINQSVPVTHTVAISDVYNYGFTVNWYVHAPGTTSTIPALPNSASFNFTPSLQVGAGQYIVEAILFDQTGTNQLDSASWNVTIEDIVAPTLISPSPAASAYSYLNTISSTVNHSIIISNPETKSGTYFMYLDGVQVTPTIGNGIIGSSTATPVSYSFIPNTLANGLHTLEIKVHDGLNAAAPVFDTYTWLINVMDPQYPVLLPIAAGETVPSLSETITIVDGIDFGTGGWMDNSGTVLTELCVRVDNADKAAPVGKDIDVKFAVNGFETTAIQQVTPNENKFCATTLNLNSAQPNFTLSNPDIAEARTITARTYVTGTGDLIEALSWNVVVRPKNIRPIISIDSANTSAVLGCSGTTINNTGCTLTQSVNNNIDSNDTNYSDTLDSTTISASDFAITLDYDPDIQAETDYEVIYQLRNVASGSWQDVDINGSGVSSSSYSYSDCNYSDTETQGSLSLPTKLMCRLRIDAFHNNGPLPSGAYELRAWIRDSVNGLGFGVSPKESNIVTWEINVIENQDVSSISIAAQDTDETINSNTYFLDQTATADVVYQESWISTSASSLVQTPAAIITPADSLAENSTVYLHVSVRDTQRDDFNISVAIDNGVIGGQSTLIPTTLVNRTDHKEYTTVVLSADIPEWVVTSATNLVNITVTVQDRPETYSGICTTCATASTNFQFNVANDNPTPVFADFSDVDLIAGEQQVIAGSPFSIPVTPSMYSDASLYDGANITWKWQVSTDGATSWTDIPNADSDNQTTPDLVWTPNLDITAGIVELRLCLGDDGTNNLSTVTAAHDCLIADGTPETYIKEWRNISVVPAQKDLARTAINPSSGTELAQWYDETSKFLYTTYTSGTSIFVEKSVFNATTNVFESVHSISFPTEDTEAGKTPVIATDLSIDGIEDTSIVIAYRVLESVTSSPQIRVRRIHTKALVNGTLADIQSTSRMAFNYCGMINSTDNSPHTTCDSNDLYDELAPNLIVDDANASFSSTSNGRMVIAVSGVVTNGVQLVLKTNAGDDITFVYNTGSGNDLVNNIVEYCSGGCSAAGTATQLAAAINTAIGDTEIDDISEEFYADDDGAGNVTIYGANEFDYYDNNMKITPYIGNIQVKSDGTWFVPYVDVSFSNQIGVTTGVSANVELGFVTAATPSTTLISSSGINNQEVHAKLVTGSLYLATKNTNANLDVYKLGDTAATLNSATSVQGVYSLGSYDFIENIRIDAGEVASSNNLVYVSSVNVGSSGTVRKLGLSIFQADLAQYKSNVDISALGFEQYVENIDQAQVIADPNNLGVSFVALTTTSLNSNPNKAYLIKTRYTDTALYSTNFDFHEFNYPQLNSTTTVQTTEGANISATAIPMTLTMGHTTAPLTTPVGAAAQDATLNPIFFAFHESATGNTIKTGLYNTDQTAVQTSSSVSGSYPAIIGN